MTTTFLGFNDDDDARPRWLSALPAVHSTAARRPLSCSTVVHMPCYDWATINGHGQLPNV